MKLVEIKVYSLCYVGTEERLTSDVGSILILFSEDDDNCLLLSGAVHPRTTNCYVIN